MDNIQVVFYYSNCYWWKSCWVQHRRRERENIFSYFFLFEKVKFYDLIASREWLEGVLYLLPMITPSNDDSCFGKKRIASHFFPLLHHSHHHDVPDCFSVRRMIADGIFCFSTPLFDDPHHLNFDLPNCNYTVRLSGSWCLLDLIHDEEDDWTTAAKVVVTSADHFGFCAVCKSGRNMIIMNQDDERTKYYFSFSCFVTSGNFFHFPQLVL